MTEALEAWRTLGIDALTLRRARAAHGAGATLDELVRQTAIPHRQAERLLTALSHHDGPVDVDGWWELAEPGPSTPPDVVEAVDEQLGRAAKPKPGLDQLQATAETLVRRALLLDRRYPLDGATVAFIGDHDATSLALRLVNPAVGIVVVDIDDDVLAHIDGESGGTVRCVWSDLRVALPPSAAGVADLAFTDPPYTPEGVALFVRRSVESLAMHRGSVVLLAYGHGSSPGLGLKVHDAMRSLKVVPETILPAFNRYHGAPAIGAASDLLFLRPTSGTTRAVGSSGDRGARIYTHGPNALESARAELSADVRSEIETLAGGTARWIDSDRAWAGLLDPTTLPATKGDDDVSIGDLRGAPAAVLLRALLVLRGERSLVIVDNAHPDTTSAAAQESLRALVGDRWSIRFRRSWPTSATATLELIAAALGDAPGPLVRRFVLDHSHAKVRNAVAEGCIAAANVTKKEARVAVDGALPEALLGSLVLELPRHQLVAVLDAATDVAVSLVRPSP